MPNMKKVMYVTASTPWGKGETFIIEEVRALRALGHQVVIVPRSPDNAVFHDKAKQLVDDSVRLPLINVKMLLLLCLYLLIDRRVWSLLRDIFICSRNVKMLIKNLSVLPKGVFIGKRFDKEEISHIHVHWGSTTATMGYIASRISGIPWSMTLHRWDIAENNMLKLKVASAAFTRCIAEDGRKELLGIVGDQYRDKIKIIYMGVWMPEASRSAPVSRIRSNVVIACPANLIEKKGHRYLIEACKMIAERGSTDFTCLLMGDGPLQEQLVRQIEQAGLQSRFTLLGRVPHDRIMAMYREREVDIVVLPSIVTDDKEREGIPVALMEAMGYGVPVVSTDTGGIGELITEGSGFLIEEKNADQLAEKLELLIREHVLRSQIGKAGQSRVAQDFDIVKNAAAIVRNFSRRSKIKLSG
ncbi:glycosyltransferase family 4 protein [Paenibacillus hemerocallicola]|uniref:Glycosyltransferase family 4 protein n=2 Tax=Paenibacillus hemerocallicola TaxID=1172614 RepID=A0A5C4TDK8_9BACL|nr:glycosyltransferase family 4 protein [Paenibacillus hemerocallicola]